LSSETLALYKYLTYSWLTIVERYKLH